MNSKNLLGAIFLLALAVSAHAQCSPTYQSGASGPPIYGGLRIDPCTITVGNIPNLWTNFSLDYGYTGAGKVATGTMGTTGALKILRVTDGNTDSAHPGANYLNNYSGGDGDEHWAFDHSMLVVGRQAGGVYYVYLFSAGPPMSVTQLQSSPGTPYTLPSKSVAFRQTTNSQHIWVFNQGINGCTATGCFQEYDLSSCVTHTTSCSPTIVQTVYDFGTGTAGVTGAHCLAGLNPTWNGEFRVSADDSLFAMAFSSTGGQGTGTIMAGYLVGSGCRVWNTGNTTLNFGPTVGGIPAGSVTGEFGPTGTMTMAGCNGGSCTGGADEFTLHGGDAIRGDQLLHLSATTCLGGSCGSGTDTDTPYFWNFATLDSMAGNGLGGHNCPGYNSLPHGTNSPQSQMAFVALFDPLNQLFTPSLSNSSDNNSPLIASANLPAPGALNLDEHCAWNADNSTDTMPILLSNTTFCLGATCIPSSNKPNNGCVIPADISGSSWASPGPPNCGSGNPFTGPHVNEVLLYQTNYSPGTMTSGSACVVTNGTTNTYESGAPPCTGSDILRLGNNGISAVNPSFNAQNATIDWSPDGQFYTVTTDWWCTLGASTSGQDTVCGGVDWQASHAYNVGDVITPSASNSPNCTFTASGTPPLLSGSIEPTGWGVLTGGDCPSTVPATGSDGNITWVRVGSIGQQNARYDVIIGSTKPCSLTICS